MGYIVTVEKTSRMGHTYTKPIFFDDEAEAKRARIDLRAEGSRLWLEAPPGYLGPCMVVATRTGIPTELAAVRMFTNTTAANAFRLSCPTTGCMYYAFRYKDPSPIMAEPHEIKEWIERVKKDSTD